MADKKTIPGSDIPQPTAAELAKARKEGALEAAREAGKDTYKYLTDGNLPGEGSGPKYLGMDDIMQFEPLLDLGIDAFAAAIADTAEPGVPEEKVAGLLSLERAGRNRTPYVQAMCERLGVDSPYEVTNAGPGYTNDVTPITELKRP